MHKNIPNKFYFINSFKKNNIDKLDNNTGVIYRNYNNKLNFGEIINIKKYCSKKKIKFYLSNNYRIAIKLGLDGAYIPSFNKNFRHLNYYTKPSFITLGSAHNMKELRLKEIQKVKLIFISSIFKKNKNFLGIYKFIKLRKLTKREVIALGGISKVNKKKLRLLRVNGFGGISYFE